MRRMVVENGLVYGTEHSFRAESVCIEDGRFAPGTGGRPLREEEQTPSIDAAAERIDASGCYVIPGLVDLHFHGAMDADVCDGTEEALRTIAAWEAQEGVTAICPATLTLPPEELEAILSCAARFAARPRESRLADLIGINMEGPFISHTKKGAQNGRYIRPWDGDLALRFLEASQGLVKIIGLAPEENPGFEEGITALKERVRISLAHSAADYDTARQAFEAGAGHVVHLFNAMPELAHRDPGIIGAAADNPAVTAELICDGNHVHPAAVRAAFSLFGPERIVLISDSLRAAGRGDGRMLLGGQEVEVKGTRATLCEGGALAGSVSSLSRCLAVVVRQMQIPLEDAVRCASENPARVLGMDGEYGSIAPGKRGNLALLDREDLSVRGVIKDGVRIR